MDSPKAPRSVPILHADHIVECDFTGVTKDAEALNNAVFCYGTDVDKEELFRIVGKLVLNRAGEQFRLVMNHKTGPSILTLSPESK